MKLLEQNPLYTDKELAQALKASVSTIRLDRALLGVPELRERTKHMAQRATSKLRSLKQSEVVGDLLELEPNKWALSVLQTKKEMAFRHTDYVCDHYVYSQASSIAIAVVEADMENARLQIIIPQGRLLFLEQRPLWKKRLRKRRKEVLVRQ